jgi:hypothetical protein
VPQAPPAVAAMRTEDQLRRTEARLELLQGWGVHTPLGEAAVAARAAEVAVPAGSTALGAEAAQPELQPASLNSKSGVSCATRASNHWLSSCETGRLTLGRAYPHGKQTCTSFQNYAPKTHFPSRPNYLRGSSKACTLRCRWMVVWCQCMAGTLLASKPLPASPPARHPPAKLAHGAPGPPLPEALITNQPAAYLQLLLSNHDDAQFKLFQWRAPFGGRSGGPRPVGPLHGGRRGPAGHPRQCCCQCRKRLQ